MLTSQTEKMQPGYLLDTNVWIRWGDGEKFTRILVYWLRYGGGEIIITSTVKKELGRINPALAGKIAPIVRLVDDSVLEIREKASMIWTHYPDNLILAVSENYGLVLVTFDRNLREEAQRIGIMAYHPRVVAPKNMNDVYLLIQRHRQTWFDGLTSEGTSTKQ